jgi:hypothetical protein
VNAREPETVTENKKTLLLGLIEEARGFRFCGPSDDPEEQTAVTSGYRYLTVQFKRLVAPLLPASAASRLDSIEVQIDNLYSAYDAKAELDALLPEIEAALERNNNASPLPVPVCSIVGDVLGSYIAYHKPLERLFYEAGAVGNVPDGNCVIKSQSWLKRLHTEVADPVAVLGKVLEVFMEVDNSYRGEEQEKGRNAIKEVLARFGLSYRAGGFILGAASALPTKSLIEILKSHDMAAVDKEFERSLANLESDPPASVTAACRILESLFKVYIEENELEMPGDQSLKPLWKAASKHLGFDPSAVEDEDLKKILSGLNSIVDGIGSLRTHGGTAHGRGKRAYRIQARHARLTIHASHTLVAFFLETWEERKRKIVNERDNFA